MKRTANKADKDRFQALAEMGCCLCIHLGYEGTPAQIHHVRVNHGWGRSGHRNTIPLCDPHHNYNGIGVHGMGRQQFTDMYGISELELLDWVNERLPGGKDE